jgi:3-phosphoshikimate 1-carboxyvinyltransferase
MASGRSEITNLSEGTDVAATRRAVGALGVVVENRGDRGGYVMQSSGIGELKEPADFIDVGNSGTLIRLLSGLVAGIDGHCVLSGDESVNRRPMGRIVGPLRSMGAKIDGRSGGEFAPLAIRGSELRGVRYRTPVASAQIKSALLLGGLSAEGETTVVEEVLTRRHTEEFLGICGVSFHEELARDGTHSVTLSRPSLIRPFEMTVPVDPSQAAFWLIAAALCPGSEVTIADCYSDPARVGFLEALIEMGADVEISGPAHYDDSGEVEVETSALVGGALPTASVSARHSKLRPLLVRGSRVSTMIDEVPALAVAALFAEGESVFADVGELAVKE